MATHAAFLRGINVGGHRVTNDELRALMADAGVDDVTTYRASGNLLLTVEGSPPPRRTGGGAGRRAGGRGRVRGADVRADRRGPARRGGPRSPDELAELRGLLFDTDRVVAEGAELHWHMATGRMMESAMGRLEVERLLGDRWTVRTAGTVQRMADKL